jgi:RNA polymerase sigma factor (sigma-70 family)
VLREATIPGEGDFAALGVSTGDSTPSGHVAREEQAEVVRRALAALNAKDRQLLVERFVQGGDIAELAVARGISPTALRQRLNRALQRVGKILNELDAAADSAANTQSSGEA